MIDGNSRGKNISIDVPFQNLRRVSHPDRERGGIINHYIPGSAFQRVQLSIAIADQLLDFVWQFPGMRFAAIECSDFVPPAQRVSNLIWSGESCSAEYKNAERCRCFLREQRRCCVRDQSSRAAHLDEAASIHI